jgi:hypothetical protein
MVAANFALLIATIWRSHRQSVIEWKDDAFVLLAVSLDDALFAKVRGGLEEPGRLVDRIGNERVCVEENDVDFKLWQTT